MYDGHTAAAAALSAVCSYVVVDVQEYDRSHSTLPETWIIVTLCCLSRVFLSASRSCKYINRLHADPEFANRIPRALQQPGRPAFQRSMVG